MIDNATRTQWSQLLALAIAHHNSGNREKAKMNADALVAAIRRTIV